MHQLKLLLQSLAYLTLVFFLLYEVDEKTKIEECTGFDAPAIALARSDYDFLIKYGTFDEPSNRRVVVVALDPEFEPEKVISNFCTQREFTARVIDRLNELKVSVIALDKIYMRDRCDENDIGTQNLQNAIKTSRAIITVGIDTRIEPKTHLNNRDLCLLLHGDSGLPLDVPDDRRGLLRLDPNTRLAPLAWPVHIVNEEKKINTVEDLPTLSFVTARAAEPQIVRAKRLEHAIRSGQQPYSTRVDIQSHSFSALQILCGAKASRSIDWRNCKSEEPRQELDQAIVMFGDHIGDADRHPDARELGGIYGVDLQANYVAAILDKRCYMPLMSSTANLLFVGIALLLLHVCFHFFKPVWRTFIFAVSAWTVIVALSFIIVSFTGYLFTTWVQGVTLSTIFVTALHYWTIKED
jgi:hypothetical protein